MVEPVPLGGELGYYSGEDMPEKTSMMAYSDVFTTVYSTMVVEAAIHNRPIVSICIDVPGGWNDPDKYSLSLKEIGEWPTHKRFRDAQAGQVAFDKESVKNALNQALNQESYQEENRKQFVDNEITYTDATSGKHVAEFLFSKIGKHFIKGV
jgi:CDP-glycerol glycerophosphotransferase (TagB/SpsB family)